jgi:alpha-L-fucosidase
MFGGNLLMNIGPGPHGDWDTEAYKRLADIGKWIKINGEGTYSSKSVAPYSDSNIFFTQSADGNREYAFVLAADNGLTLSPVITLKTGSTKKVQRVTLLGSTQKLKWKQDGGVINVTIPPSLQNGAGLQYAATFKVVY